MANYIFDAPVAYATAATAAAYDGTVGSSVGVAVTPPSVVYKRCSGVCGLKISALGFQVTVAIAGATAPVLTITVRPTFGSGTGARTVGTITIPATAIVGDVVEAVFSSDNINVNPGEEVVVEVTTVGTGVGSGFVTAMFEAFLVGPTSGGTTSVPVVTTKPFGTTKVGQIKLVSSGATGQ